MCSLRDSPELDQAVPTRVAVGVTGHRHIPNVRVARDNIRNALIRLDKIPGNTPHTLEEQARRAGLPPGFLDSAEATLLPHYARADLLAQRYQKRHMIAGTAIYAFAAAAVATVTVQILLFSDITGLLWLEVAEIAVILLLLIASRFGDWHDKWIEYRSLAEHLRAATFSSIAGVDCRLVTSLRYPGKTSRPGDWVGRAFSWLWEALKSRCADDSVPLDALKSFLLSAWIDDQFSYYKATSTRQRKWHHRLARTQELVFLLTLIVAILHAVGLDRVGLADHSAGHDILLVVVIVLPAVGAAIAGIRMHREYQRNAEQYDAMARHLSTIGEEIRQATDRETLVRLVEEARELMLREHQQWRDIFQFRQLETP